MYMDYVFIKIIFIGSLTCSASDSEHIRDVTFRERKKELNSVDHIS